MTGEKKYSFLFPSGSSRIKFGFDFVRGKKSCFFHKNVKTAVFGNLEPFFTTWAERSVVGRGDLNHSLLVKCLRVTLW